ncbi:hypothetical protein ZWY2020_002422 [Hordeum vulgare]|nr:hypothetical protein ZWY2020_002422 [Hordeum vulgare]
MHCARRTGKRRYPSEKKRLDRRHKEQLRQTAPEEGSVAREGGFWRLSKLAVPASNDPGKDFLGVSPPLLQAIAKALKFPATRPGAAGGFHGRQQSRRQGQGRGAVDHGIAGRETYLHGAAQQEEDEEDERGEDGYGGERACGRHGLDSPARRPFCEVGRRGH